MAGPRPQLRGAGRIVQRGEDPAANSAGDAPVSTAVSSLNTCVCVSRRVATIGFPDRRYW